MAEVTKYQSFKMERVLRSSLKDHPANPRRITDEAAKKIKDAMKDVGLLQPIIVNRRRMFVLGGHQRLHQLDKLQRYKEDKPDTDYQLDVAMVDLDDKQEAKMLVFLNNPSAQGTWDLDLLADLSLGAEVSMTDMGFDKVDVEMMFDGDPRFEELFPDSAEVGESKDALAMMRADGTAPPDSRPEGEDLKALKEERKGFNERRMEKANADFYVVVVCEDKKQKDELMDALGISRGEQYINPHEILTKINGGA